MSEIELDEFKQAIAEIYDRRRDTYDRGGEDNWHYKLACRLVECAEIKAGQQVLDLASPVPVAKSYDLLEIAGYRNIQIVIEQYGYYTDLESVAIKDWDISLQHPHCQPLLQLEPQQLEQLKTEYKTELESLVTEQGIWNDITTYFVTSGK